MDASKILALYLPQYHEIPENDAWWGKGFTEWVNVKRAKKLFKWQNQPKKPLGDNYYDLMNKETVKWQTDLAKKYGVDGFCYFHYYFKGRKILEKPAENLLRWKEIDHKFCFFWANVSWRRTWKNCSKEKQHYTSWSPGEDNDSASEGILLEQTYGTVSDWETHFDYLLPFFKDDRYIKKDNKPIFFIYKINDIGCANEMFSLWNKKALEKGFDGIHLVSVNDEPIGVPEIEAIAHYGFHKAFGKGLLGDIGQRIINKVKHSMGQLLSINYLKSNVYDYEDMWKKIISKEPYGDLPNYPGAFVNYDDTPRRGIDGFALRNSRPELFRKYMGIQLRRAKAVFKSDYILLDAWNEWGEGNYLEPDEENKYSFLEALRDAKEEIMK